VTIVPFLAVAFGAGALSLLTRRSTLVSGVIGIGGLLLAALVAMGIDADETMAVGGGELVGSAYLRLFVVLGSIVALILAILGFATTTHRHAPGVLLAGIGAAGLALALPDARIAVLAASAGGLIGILVTVMTPATARSVVVASRELRAIAVAGVLAILATAWIGRSLGELAAEPAVFGMAYLGFAAAVAIRFGAIPFHFWAARLADAAPEVTLPMLMAWSPAAFAVVALAWADQSVAPLVLPLSAERGLILAVGAVSIVLGAVAAWIQDDLEHVVGYLIIADAGVAILGLAALQPEAWEPARTWVLSFVVVRSAFAAWAVALRAAFGTRRIPDLRGWAIRAPGLGVAFVVIAVAGIAWPGLASWNARATLIDLTLDGPFYLLVTLGALAPIAVYGRLAMVGLARPAERLGPGFVERPALPASVAVKGRGADAVRAVAATVLEVGRLNRVLVASVLVGVLAVLSFTVSAGGLGVVDAARAVPQQVPRPTDGPVSPSPSSGESAEPTGAPSTAPTEEPSAEASAPAPSFQPLPSASP
jgi:NADH:ubiquinone oxidoreductase subunit 2 (subunit N)